MHVHSDTLAHSQRGREKGRENIETVETSTLNAIKLERPAINSSPSQGDQSDMRITR